MTPASERCAGLLLALLLALAGAAGCARPMHAPDLPPEMDAERMSEATRLFLEAELLRLGGEAADARLLYLQVISLEDRDWTPWLRLAQVSLALEKWEEARQASETAHRLDAPPELAIPVEAEALRALDRSDEALGRFAAEAVTAERPPRYYEAWARFARSLGDLDALHLAAARWDEAHAPLPQTHRFLARLFAQLDAPAEAAARWEAAGAEPDGNAEDLLRAHEIFGEVGDEAGRARVRETCRTRYPESVPCLLHDAQALAHRPPEERAPILDAIARRIAPDPALRAEYTHRVGDTLGTDDLQYLLEAMVQRRPANARLHEEAAWALWRFDQKDAALLWMERALELEPLNADVLNFIGYTWVEQNRNLAQAEVYLLEALQLRPDDAYILDSVGWLRYRQGRLEEAEALLRQSIAQNDSLAIVHEHLGIVLEARGDLEGAAQAWFQALQVDGGRDAELIERVQARLRAIGQEAPAPSEPDASLPHR